MNQDLQSGDAQDKPGENNDILAAITKMQQQLVYLERKIDQLIEGQSSQRTVERAPRAENYESRPPRHEKKPFAKTFPPPFGKVSSFGEKKYGNSFSAGKKSFGGKKKFFGPPKGNH